MWLSRFDPCWITGDAITRWWVTDRFRMHRLSPEHLLWLADRFGFPEEALELTFQGQEVQSWDLTNDWSPTGTLKWLSRSVQLRVYSASERGHVQMVNGDMQVIRIDGRYYRDAVMDGARQWRGTAPARPVFGLDETGNVVAALMPRTSARRVSPAHRTDFAWPHRPTGLSRAEPQRPARGLLARGSRRVRSAQGDAFDPTLDFRADSQGRDPDAASATLRRYHQLLWSKTLPRGAQFALVLDDTYLRHVSDAGVLLLSSDASVPTWSRLTKFAHIRRFVNEKDLREFDAITHQMGAMMLFPRNRIDGLPSINQQRGCTPAIGDRLDLTVECIRRFYEGVTDPQSNPLGPTLARYADFFGIFTDFPTYAQFWLLQDLLTEDLQEVIPFLPFTSFNEPALPQSMSDYVAYRSRAIAFVEARNKRMLSAVESRPDNSGV